MWNGCLLKGGWDIYILLCSIFLPLFKANPLCLGRAKERGVMTQEDIPGFWGLATPRHDGKFFYKTIPLFPKPLQQQRAGTCCRQSQLALEVITQIYT